MTVARSCQIEVLRLIDGLREDLRHRVAQPRRWIGTLRRTTFARAVQGSNSIEGYNASLDDVAAAVEGEPTLAATAETQRALTGYRDAMTYMLHVAEDDNATIDEGMIKALHFMMLKHDLSKSPGRWRPGYIAVRNDETGKIVYEGPDADLVSPLIGAMLDALHRDDTPALVKAAMAHLNLVMIHPFRDGNGRMARCLQTLVIARERINAPVFSSVEEYLGRNTQAYYDILAEVGQGGWHPGNGARPWLRFMLTAHHRLPDRCAAGLSEVALGLRLRRNSYMTVIEASAGEAISGAEQALSIDCLS